MDGKTYGAWMHAGVEAWALGLETSMVIGMRMAKIASGGDSDGAEARLMVAEKVQAALELQTRLVTGGLGTTPLAGARKTMRHYKRKVSANRRRLSAGR